MSYSPKTYREQGGDTFVVASGGKIKVETGGDIEHNGVSLIDEIAALSGLDSGELGILEGASAGSITASKVVTRDAAKNIPLFGAVLAALGNSQATAAAVAAQATLVTGADNTTAVRLPTAVVGQTFLIVNTVADKTLPVYPATGADINGLGANNAFTMGPGHAGIFHCTALLTWYVNKQAAATPDTTELALLAGAGTGGTPVASKAQVADANQNIGAVKATSLAVGVSGSEVTVTASPAQLNSCDAGVGAAAGTGVTAVETGFGNFKTTTLTLVDTPVPLADEAGVVAYGGLKIYDFPQGYLFMQSAVADLAITKSSAGVNVDWDGDIGLGTVTATNNAGPLAGTEQNILPNTATPQAVAGATTGDGVSTATEHAILDGTSAAVDLFVNLLVDDADHNVAGTPCDLILNGTIVINWLFMGDN